MLQKKFTVDYIEKGMKVNEGEVTQYYVHNSHEAIIFPIEFDMVQADFARRKQMGRSYSGNAFLHSVYTAAPAAVYMGRRCALKRSIQTHCLSLYG